jgi:ATP-dependent Clp protease adaptor protein ClpS
MSEEKNQFNANTHTKTRQLILHNDNRHSFSFVKDTLVDICLHDEIQAEQCATLAHHAGKCDIKKGSFNELKHLQEELISRGLIVTLD